MEGSSTVVTIPTPPIQRTTARTCITRASTISENSMVSSFAPTSLRLWGLSGEARKQRIVLGMEMSHEIISQLACAVLNILDPLDVKCRGPCVVQVDLRSPPQIINLSLRDTSTTPGYSASQVSWASGP